MVVLGLLQNQWAHNPAAVTAMFARHPDRRSTLIWYMLARSLSGRRLCRAFGDWVDRIIWENASPMVATRSDHRMVADVDHVNRRLTEIQPDVVLTLGKSAAEAIIVSCWSGMTINAPHPAARFPDIHDQLVVACAALNAFNSKGT